MAKKLEAQGAVIGDIWDDGGAYENVKKVYVGRGEFGVVYIKFDYVKDGKIVSVEHGDLILPGTYDFEVDPEDYITSMKVYYENEDILLGLPTKTITGLVFKTFKGKTSETLGIISAISGQEAELGGGKIVGFHGSSSLVLHSLGVYIVPSSTPLIPSFNTVPAQGGDAGVAWDDGVHDGVKKIYVGQGESGVTFFKAEYEKASKPVLGSDHGKMSKLGAEEFELGPGEYITAVTGKYQAVYGLDAPAIISLKFTTNKRVSVPYGLEAGTDLELKKEGYKIVGFYGQASDYLYKIGVHVVPIAN